MQSVQFIVGPSNHATMFSDDEPEMPKYLDQLCNVMPLRELSHEQVSMVLQGTEEELEGDFDRELESIDGDLIDPMGETSECCVCEAVTCRCNQ